MWTILHPSQRTTSPNSYSVRLAAAKLRYPAIAPPGAVTSQKFSAEEPTHTAATLVLLLDVIPSICDLLPTTSAMESAYAEGMRSVVVEFQINDEEYCYCYHFMKVQ